MAKTVTKKAARSSKAKSKVRPGTKSNAAPKRPAKSSERRGAGRGQRSKAQSPMSASDALVGLLESPLVADILAAGAAAALASFTQHRLTRRAEGNSKQALKGAAKAAAAAMGARLSEELDEILESAKSRVKSEGV